MEKITNEIAEQVTKWFASDEVKGVVEATQKAADGDTGTFEVVITTENLDRYQEVISMDGWELEHYRSNPVVLWGHDHFTLPIGVATDVRIENGKMIASGKFAPHDHAQDIRRLYDMGIVRATSVGFIEKEREGNLITKAELLEFSFVSVPANPYALSLAIEKDLNVNELVTKGIFTLKDIKDTEKDTEEPEKDTKEEEETAPEEISPEPPVDEPIEEDQPTDEPEPEPELTDEQKALAAAITKQVLAGLKDAGALEDTPGDPERTDDEDVDEEGEAEEEKAFRHKKTLQQIDTMLGDVLAEMRQR